MIQPTWAGRRHFKENQSVHAEACPFEKVHNGDGYPAAASPAQENCHLVRCYLQLTAHEDGSCVLALQQRNNRPHVHFGCIRVLCNEQIFFCLYVVQDVSELEKIHEFAEPAALFVFEEFFLCQVLLTLFIFFYDFFAHRLGILPVSINIMEGFREKLHRSSSAVS